MRTLTHASLVCLISVAGCGSTAPEEGTDFADVRIVDIPDEIQTKEHAVVMRITDAAASDAEVYEAMNSLLGDISAGDLLSRGGLPVDEEGNLVPFGSGSDAASAPGDHADMLGGTSVEQVRALIERLEIDRSGPFPAEEAVDSCGNPVLASFIPTSQFQHAAVGSVTDNAMWPASCGDDASCDDLEVGVVEFRMSDPRANGGADMVVKFLPDTLSSPRRNGLFGHVLGFFPSTMGPGFAAVPLAFNVSQMSVEMKNLWQLQDSYDGARGSRDVFAIPGSQRTLYADEVEVAAAPLQAADCIEQMREAYGGTDLHGCSEGNPLLVDRNAPAGQEVFSVWMEDGANPANQEQIRDLFYYSLQAAAACPSVPFGTYASEGPLELLLCGEEDGTMWQCLAKEDMEEGACRPVEGEFSTIRPISMAEAIELPTQTYPIYLVGLSLETGDTGTAYTAGTGGTGDTGTDTGTAGDSGLVEVIPPFAGTHATVEIEVAEGTVLFLDEPERFDLIVGPDGVVELPEPLLNGHCEEGASKRYEIGEEWPPGIYTLQAPWSDLSEDLFIHNTSMESWVQHWQ